MIWAYSHMTNVKNKLGETSPNTSKFYLNHLPNKSGLFIYTPSQIFSSSTPTLIDPRPSPDYFSDAFPVIYGTEFPSFLSNSSSSFPSSFPEGGKINLRWVLLFRFEYHSFEWNLYALSTPEEGVGLIGDSIKYCLK